MSAPRWDEWDGSLVDDEITSLTRYATEFALTSARAEVGERFVYAIAGAAIRLRTFGYVTEVRGQISAGGHGNQGAHPARVAALRELDEQVRMVFVDTRSASPSTSQSWQAVWLDLNEPEIANIDKRPDHRRQGWAVRDLIRGRGLIPFPEAPPARVEPRQGVMF